MINAPRRHRPAATTRPRVRRAGRVLIECCVALVLVAGGSALVLLAAAGTATLVDAAQLEDRVQRANATIAARVHQNACGTGAPLPPAVGGDRLTVSEAHVLTDSLHRVNTVVGWQAPALATSLGRSVAMSTAGVCE